MILSSQSRDEDIHMNIEKTLIDEIGPVGGKLHTGRSRNDQVATDMHLYLRKRVVEFVDLLHKLQAALVEQAKVESRYDCARLYASAAGAADSVRPSSDGVRIDVRP